MPKKYENSRFQPVRAIALVKLTAIAKERKQGMRLVPHLVAKRPALQDIQAKSNALRATSQTIGNDACQRPNPHFSGSGERDKVLSRQKGCKIDLLCSCRQPLAKVRDLSGHLKSANLDLLSFRA